MLFCAFTGVSRERFYMSLILVTLSESSMIEAAVAYSLHAKVLKKHKTSIPLTSLYICLQVEMDVMLEVSYHGLDVLSKVRTFKEPLIVLDEIKFRKHNS